MARKKGRGMACIIYGTGYGNGFPDVSSATVELHDDGSATVHIGAVDCGQGSDTVLVQIAAQELGLDTSQVTLVTGDTDSTPDAGTTAATRQTYTSGNAVLRAARKVKDKLLECATGVLGVNTPEGLEVAGGYISIRGYPQKRVSIKELASKARLSGIRLLGTGTFITHTTSVDTSAGQGAPYWPYAFATQIAEVEVDTNTGRIQVLKVIAAHDVGKAINPQSVRGQIAGGVAQGIGYALLEEVQLKEGGITNPYFSQYLIPTCMDVPVVEPIIVEDGEPSGPYGAKGVGEPAMLPTAPAILNAIYDAIGVRFTSLPVTPEKLLTALKDKAEAR